MLIIHMLPDNTKVCGGVKVHYQLCKLEEALGYQSFIAFPDSVIKRPVVNWFEHSCFEITYSRVKQWYDQKQEMLLVGWEDPTDLYYYKDAHKVCYIQGFAYLKNLESYFDHGIRLWYSSEANKEAIFSRMASSKLPAFLDSIIPVLPYIDGDVYYPYKDKKMYKLNGSKVSVMVQERKGGEEVIKKLQQKLAGKGLEKVAFGMVRDTTEKIFAEALRLADIFIPHSYPEGLGLPGLEAMRSRTLVVGYTGLGGDEFLMDNVSGFVAKDGNIDELSTKLQMAVNLSQWDYFRIIQQAETIAYRYTVEQTLSYLQKALSYYATI